MRVALLDDYCGLGMAAADWSCLPEHVEIVSLPNHFETERDVARALSDFQVVVAMRERTPFPESLLVQLRDLELLITTGMWNRAIDMEGAGRAGIMICGTESLRPPAVELTWTFILALARNLVDELAAMRAGDWQTGAGMDLCGSTLGVIGLGRLGSRVAAIGQAFGMRVLAWSQNLAPERATVQGVEFASKEDLLTRSDFVTLHTVLSDRTRGLIGASELAAMKRSAYLINTSRGPLVDETALVAALESGAIAGAGLDVFDREPLPSDHPLRRLRNALVTPHIGVATHRNYGLFYNQAAENIAAYLGGKPIRVLNKRA